MDTIRVIATFTAIASENRESFKGAVVELTEFAASEEGTLEYSYYLTTDETRCLLIETYASPEALSVHIGHVGHLLGRCSNWAAAWTSASWATPRKR